MIFFRTERSVLLSIMVSEYRGFVVGVGGRNISCRKMQQTRQFVLNFIAHLICVGRSSQCVTLCETSRRSLDGHLHAGEIRLMSVIADTKTFRIRCTGAVKAFWC